MALTFPSPHRTLTAKRQRLRNELSWWLWFLAILGLTALLSRSGLRGGIGVSTIAWLICLCSIWATCYQPRWGVYLIVGLTLAGDRALVPWYPFIQNFSTGSSLLFLHNAAIFSPLELFLALTLGAWLFRLGMIRKRPFYTGPLFWPAIVFSSFITIALVYGLSRGGNINVALWEARSLYYLPIMLILVSNLIKTREQINTLVWIAMIGIFIKGIFGVWFVAEILKFNISSVQEIAEHSASIHLNSFIIMSVAIWVYRGSPIKRLLLPAMLPCVLFTHFANQRRAAMVAVILALIVIIVLLIKERPLVFVILAPTILVFGTVYILAFWNSTGPIAMPARAIKSIIAPDAASARDNASNKYRELETINIMYTIKTSPLTGVGFGQKFYVVAPMDDISTFVWWEYITHNSILWFWMQTGVGGFMSMIFLVGFSLMIGIRTLFQMPNNELGPITLTALLYILMHFIFAYVDMSWFDQNMVYIGTMMGILNCLHHIVSQPLPPPARRWPWQAERQPPPGLCPR